VTTIYIPNAVEQPTNGRVTRICYSPERGWYVRGGEEKDQAKARVFAEQLAKHTERTAA